MARKFELINDKGKTFSLNDLENYCFLSDPSGLGYEYKTEYEQLGYSFIEALKQVQQGEISGTLNFKNYDNYKKLVDYIEHSSNLKFSYQVPYKNSTKTFYKNVNIKSITKTQKNKSGRLVESVTFDCLSLWYERRNVSYTARVQGTSTWDMNWDPVWTGNDACNVEFINDGHVDASIQVEIAGSVTNPLIRLYEENVLIQSIPITAVIASGYTFKYSSKENEFYIKKVQESNQNETDLFTLNNIVFSNDNVLRIPPQKSCRIQITADNQITSAKLSIYVYYKAV